MNRPTSILIGIRAQVIAPVALALAALGPWPALAQAPEAYVEPAPGLELADVLALAADHNPMLRALRSAAAAAAAREPEASTLPDPVLQLGLMNFGVPSLSTDMPTSMAPSVQLMQMVPFPGKRGLMADIAAADRESAETDALEAGWEVRSEVASVFYGMYTLDRQLDVMRATLGLLNDFQDVARAMYASGTGRQADVLRADVEVGRMDAEIRRMEAMRRAHAAELNAMLGRPAATEVPSPALGDLPAGLPPRDTLLAWARASRPALRRGDLSIVRARAEVALARKEIWPDLALGVAYGQRDAGMGMERMASVMVELSLPVHAGSRQYAMRAEAAAMEEMARHELVGLEASVDAGVGIHLAELERARVLRALYHEEVIPEARANVESAYSSYRVGAVDFMTLVDAQMSVNRYEGELFQLLGDYGKALAALEAEVGRVLPRTGPQLGQQP